MSESAAAPAVVDASHNQENESARPVRSKKPSAKARAAVEAADDSDDNGDGDNYSDGNEKNLSDDEAPQPTRRGGREVRRSEKAAQQFDEQEETAARKTLKANKAVQKQRQKETGEGPQPTPLQDTVFQSREVEVHNKRTKTLVPRDSRIPATPAGQSRTPAMNDKYRDATSLSIARSGLASRSIPDRRRPSEDEMEVDENDPRPRGINGNLLPSHARLDLRAFPPYRAEQWAVPRRRSPSPGLERAHADHGHETQTQSHDHHRREPSQDADHYYRRREPSQDVDHHSARPASPPIQSQSQRRRREPSPELNRAHPEPSSPPGQPRGRDQVASTSTPQRSSSPATGSKRARSPAEDFRQTQAQKLNDHQGRARAKDFDSTTQEVVSTALTYFRCLVATEDAFPDHTSETHLLTLAWAMARDEHKIVMDLTPDIAKIVTSRTSQLRGELKTKVRGLVELTFGFRTGQNKKDVRKNRQLAEDLKEDMGYAYETNPSKSEGRKGLYKANIIQQSTNLMWFSNRRAEGATHPEMFGPALPKPTLALVLTAVECGIDEWATGIKTDVPFTTADYRSIYLDHIKSLTDFEKRSAPRDILGNILTRLHNIGRFHSGAQPLVAARTSSLSTSAIDAAIREYDENSETETEGEFGEDSDV